MINVEWIAGGVLLLGCAMIMRRLQNEGTFRTVIISFTVVWSGLVALHFWGGVDGLLTSLGAGWLPEGVRAAAGFWLCFVVAAVPGFVLLCTWLKQYATTFPPTLDGVLLWGCSLLTCFVFVTLVFMTLGTLSPDGRFFHASRIGWRGDRVPLRTYISVSAWAAASPADAADHDSSPTTTARPDAPEREPASHTARRERLPVVAAALLEDTVPADPDDVDPEEEEAWEGTL